MRRSKARHPVRRVILLIVILAILAVLGYAGWVGYSIYHFAASIQKTPETSQFHQVTTKSTDKKVPEPPKWEGTERVNILLMGGDSRGLKPDEVPRSDSMLILSIDPVTKQADLFSVLRDTYVSIPGYGRNRINAALAFGGPDLAVKTVSDFLNIPIQYYVYTDFKGFIAMIDAIGGIDYYVEKNMNYADGQDDHIYDIHLKKGEQHLDGKTALEYVRFRHDARSDFARTQRQRAFLKAVAKKLESTSSLMKLPIILRKVSPYVETNMTLTDMWKLAGIGYQIRTSQVVTQQIPPDKLLRDEVVAGSDVLGADKNKVQQFVQEVLNQPPPDLAERDASNGSSRDAQSNVTKAGKDKTAEAG